MKYTPIFIGILLFSQILSTERLFTKTHKSDPKFFPFPPNTGYIDVYPETGNSMFYWYFEAKNNPETAPVVIWIDGGPGCASTWGLFGQVGPYTIDQYDKDHREAKVRNINWSQNAHLVFPDQPLGIGFSTVTPGKEARNYKQLQEQFLNFYKGFLEKNPKLKGKDIYVIGESYGGHYAPYIGDVLHKSLNGDIKLKAVGIINGYISGKILYETYPDYSLQMTKYTKFEKSDYDEIKPLADLCTNMVDYKGNPMIADQNVCSKVSNKITAIAKKRNPSFDPYYMPGGDVTSLAFVGFLNDPDVQKIIGARKEFQPCNNIWGNMFGNVDYFVDSRMFISPMLEDGVKFLVFDGDLDWICNYMQEEKVLDEMEWSGKFGWSQAGLEKCEFGLCKEFMNLRYVRFKGAGHAAPKFQPENALKLVNEFIGFSE